MNLTLSELFASIQGEGSAQGLPCTFVRLAGCPLRCRWCDTAYARDGGEDITVEETVRRVRALGLPLVEITGGEPLAQAATPELARQLLAAGLQVLCETSGAFDIGALPAGVARVMDLKAPGSGESHRMLWSNLDALTPRDDVKIVCSDRGDYDWACAAIREHRLAERAQVVLTAATPHLDPAQLAGWMIEDRLPARLQVQLHKVLWPADDRGR